MIANKDRTGWYLPLGPRGRRIMLAISGCLSTGFGVWYLLVHGRVTPVFWVIGPFSLLATTPTNQLPRRLRDLGYKAQIRAGLGVFALGLVLDLAPLLNDVLVPRQAHKLTFWLAIFGIGLMVVGLLTATMGTNDWAERYMASHPDTTERLDRQRRRR